MPGIAGIITRNPNVEQVSEQVALMLDAMLHEPFYRPGVFVCPEVGCYVGWVSHERSYSDCNPVVNAARDVSLVFAGEHFGHVSGRRSRGIPASAGELLDLYAEDEGAFLGKLNGWFAGVLMDRRARSAVLFNDRYGVHRIYYTETPDAFIFASEAKAVLAVAPAARSLDAAALGQFLVFGHALGERSLFSQLHVMPGGASWRFTGSRAPEKRRYFEPAAWEQQPVASPEGFYEDLKAAVAGVTPRYFQAATGVGMSLTGGLDTRIIMAARPQAAEPTPCYTYGGYYRDCYDVQVASEVAAACGQPYQVIPLGQDFFDDFASYAERTVFLTDGCLDITGSHELYFSERARVISPVRVTGNYGSEVLRSVSTFKGGLPSADLFTPDVLSHCRDALVEFGDLRSANEVTFAAMQDIPWHLFGRLAVAQSQLVLRSPYMDNDVVAVTYRAPRQLRKTNGLSLRLIGDLSPRLQRIATDMGFVATGSQMLSYPRRLHRYATFKAEWYYNLGMPEWLGPLDRTLLQRLSPLFLGWHKIDHFRVWFRDQLSGYISDMLSGSEIATRPYLKRGASRRLLDTRRITGPYVHHVSLLLTLELIQQTLLRPTVRTPKALASLVSASWSA